MEKSTTSYFETIFATNGQSILQNEEIHEIIDSNKEICILFKFDFNSYNSQIVIMGLDDKKEYKIKTPTIPLIGGVWSNYVATRCMTGQVLISAMLESIMIQLTYIVRDKKKDTKIIKCDNCFYAPFLYYTVDKSNNFCDITNKNVQKEYHHILKENNTEAYSVVKILENINSRLNYWESFHDRYIY